MSDKKKVTETTEVTTETRERSASPLRDDSTYQKETSVTTERKVEKDEEDKPVIVIKN